MSRIKEQEYDISASKIEIEKGSKKDGINALKSFDAIMAVVDRRRPYEPSDFIAESFIPYLCADGKYR